MWQLLSDAVGIIIMCTYFTLLYACVQRVRVDTQVTLTKTRRYAWVAGGKKKKKTELLNNHSEVKNVRLVQRRVINAPSFTCRAALPI